MFVQIRLVSVHVGVGAHHPPPHHPPHQPFEVVVVSLSVVKYDRWFVSTLQISVLFKVHVVAGIFHVHVFPSADLNTLSTSPLVPHDTTKLIVKFPPVALSESLFAPACIVVKITLVVNHSVIHGIPDSPK